MKKVLYYNIDDNLDYENSLLEKWNIHDLELCEIKDKDRKKCFREEVRASNPDGLVVEYDTVTADIMDDCPNLKIVALQSIGYNNVSVEAATAHHICVTNVPGFCADEVALHAIGLAIDLARKITFFDRSVQNGEWNPLLGYPLYRLTNKTFGLVFFGEIPKKMVPMLHALGLKILVYAPTKSKEFLAQYGCEKAESLDELCLRSDFVSLHCPLIKEITYHLIGEKQLRQMKKTAFLINTSRGAVVDEQALVKALKDGAIQAAAIDVIENEDTEKSDLIGLPNCILTPHSAFMSQDSFYEARERSLLHLAERLSDEKNALIELPNDHRPKDLVNKILDSHFFIH